MNLSLVFPRRGCPLASSRMHHGCDRGHDHLPLESQTATAGHVLRNNQDGSAERKKGFTTGSEISIAPDDCVTQIYDKVSATFLRRCRRGWAASVVG